VTILEAQTAVARGRESEECIVPVTDTEDRLLVQVAHALDIGQGTFSANQNVPQYNCACTDMRYTLRQLEVFLAVARHESISRAGQELAMSQSAVSGALADLERQFDILLFDRVGKRLQLSTLGLALRPRLQALHEQALEVEQALTGESDVGVLRVGATLTIGNYLIPPLLARFMQQHPAARVRLEIANTAEIARKVSNFEIDIGLIEGELVQPELEVSALCDDELVVFCAPTHPFANLPALTDDHLRAATWIVREPGSGTRQAFERAMHGILVELRVALELQHTEAIKSAVEHGIGLGCVSRIALAEAFRSGQLKPCAVPGRDFHRQFYFVLHKQKHRSAGIARWIALLQAEQHDPRSEANWRRRANRANQG
jgi:DNA-binding transcriptional LysR family regulator